MTLKLCLCIALIPFTALSYGQSTETPPNPIPLTILETVCGSSSFSEPWNYVGPTDQMLGSKPYQGIITSVVMRPDNPQILFASGNSSGLFKTIDGGQNWYNVTDGLGAPGLGITDIEFSPDDPDVMYATTGENANEYGNYSVGLIMSEDGGETWDYIDQLGVQINYSNPWTDAVLTCLKINPLNPDEIYVGGYKTIYHTTDAGNTWTYHEFPESGAFLITDIEFDPNDNDIVFCSSKSRVDETTENQNQGIFPVLNIWVSEDDGTTWSVRNPVAGRHQAVTLDTTPADNSGAVYTAFRNDNIEVQVMKTIDGGLNWSIVAQDLPEATNPINGDWSYYKHEFEMSNISANVIYYGGVTFRMARLTNSGWSSQAVHANMHDDIREINLYENTLGIETILVGSDGGVQFMNLDIQTYLSNGASGLTWSELNGDGLQITQIYGGGEWDRNGSIVYGAQDLGTWKLGGNSFINSGDGRYTNVNDFFNFGIGGSQLFLNKILNYGSNTGSLTVPSIGPLYSSAKLLRLKQYFSPKDQRKLFVPWEDLSIVTFDPNTTNFTSSNVTSTLQITGATPDDILNATAIGISPSDDQIVYIAFRDVYGTNEINNLDINSGFFNASGDLIHRLLKSYDGGTTFSEDLTNDLHYEIGSGQYYPYSFNPISYLIVDPMNSNKVYAAFNSYAGQPDLCRVITSDDGGHTWQDMSEGLGSYPVNQLLYQDGSNEVIYAATDGGVFRWNTQNNIWDCFNNGLPPCIVTSMDIDPCENSLMITTYGRGIWKVELPEIEDDMVFDFDYTIDTYETHSYQNNIIVEDGATLTIKGHVYLKPDKAIIVKVGGHLVVDGGLISNSCIGVLAQGIVVEGNPDEDQSPESNQGLCELKNQGLIENMHNGVLLAGLELDGNGHCVTDLDKTGGIVKAKDFTFRNCYVGAEFFEYIAHSTHPQHWPIPNHSYFYNCDFETTRVLDLSTLGFQPEPKAGIIMNGTYKIKILGCRMANYAVGTDPFFDSQYKRGDGIQAFNAIFTVKNYCETTACPNPIQSSFENLEHGVLSLCYDFTSTFDVRDATFTNNYCGIRSEGALLGPIIRNCDFYINDLDDNSDGEEPVGINLDNTTAFHVQENHFYDTSAGTGPPTIGIALQNTALNGLNPSEIHETSSNQIYRNWFEGLDIACNVEGINQVEDANNPQESFGLEFRCNKFGQLGNDCQKDFNLFAGASVQKTQGSYLGNGVAGNLFYDSDCDYDYEHWDAGMGASPLTHYYYLQDSQSAILKPICSDENETNPLLVFGSFDENSTCPVQLVSPIITNPQIIKQDHAVKKSAFINTQNVFHGVLDGGDPLALKNLIENPASESAEIRNELLEFSPNISDQIWARCIERQPAMNPWHLTQVLLHASPLGSTVLRMVKNSNMPQNFKNMVENGQYEGMRDKEIFESDLATLAQEANELRSQFLRHYVLFEEDENIDVMTPVLQFLNESEVHLDKYLQAAFLQSKGAFASSGNVLNYCIKTSPQKEYYQVLETILEARQAQTFPNLSLLQMSDLVTLSADEYTCGTTQARALHRRLTETEYPMNINTEIPSLRSQRISSIQNSAMTFQIQPNPANGQCWIQFPYSPEAANVELILIDITGKLVAQSSLISAKGLYELNTTKLEDGLYIVQLQIDHMLVGTEKLTIQH